MVKMEMTATMRKSVVNEHWQHSRSNSKECAEFVASSVTKRLNADRENNRKAVDINEVHHKEEAMEETPIKAEMASFVVNSRKESSTEPVTNAESSDTRQWIVTRR